MGFLLLSFPGRGGEVQDVRHKVLSWGVSSQYTSAAVSNFTAVGFGSLLLQHGNCLIISYSTARPMWQVSVLTHLCCLHRGMIVFSLLLVVKVLFTVNVHHTYVHYHMKGRKNVIS